MITIAIIVALSLLVAVVAAGFVWYGTALVENLLAIHNAYLTRKAAETSKEAEADEPGAEEPGAPA